MAGTSPNTTSVGHAATQNADGGRNIKHGDRNRCMVFTSSSYESAFSRYYRSRDVAAFRRALVTSQLASIGIGAFELFALYSYLMLAGRICMLVAASLFLAGGARCHRFVRNTIHAPMLAFVAIETALVVFYWWASMENYTKSEETQILFGRLVGGRITYWAATSGYWSMLTLYNCGLRFHIANYIAVGRLIILLIIFSINRQLTADPSMPPVQWEYFLVILVVLGMGAAKQYFQEWSQRSEYVQLRKLVGDS